MEIEIAAIMTIAGKLELLEKLLDRRMMRAALNTSDPALPLLETVYKLGEYKRLAANLAVMEHRIRCAIGDERADAIVRAARRAGGLQSPQKPLAAALKAARKALYDLGVLSADLHAYTALPLYKAECAKIRKRQARDRDETAKKPVVCPPKNVPTLIDCGHAAAYACCRDGRTVRA